MGGHRECEPPAREVVAPLRVPFLVNIFGRHRREAPLALAVILVALGRWRLGFGLGFDALLVVVVVGAEVPIALRTLRLDPLEDTSPLELVC